jgi:Ca2+/H+ antiporter
MRMVHDYDTILITLPLVMGESCFFGSIMHADSFSNMKLAGKAGLILHSLQLQAQVTLASLR